MTGVQTCALPISRLDFVWGIVSKKNFVEVKEFKIPVSWTVTATMNIVAESLEKAINLAHEASLPTDPDYLDDSFKVDEELIGIV